MSKVTCVECGKNHCWSKGRVPNRAGPKRRYVCFDCGRTFYVVALKPAPKPKPVKKVTQADVNVARERVAKKRAALEQLEKVVKVKTKTEKKGGE